MDPYFHGCYWEPELIPEVVGVTFLQAAAPLVAAEVLAVASVAGEEEVLAAAAPLVAGNAESGNR